MFYLTKSVFVLCKIGFISHKTATSNIKVIIFALTRTVDLSAEIVTGCRLSNDRLYTLHACGDRKITRNSPFDFRYHGRLEALKASLK